MEFNESVSLNGKELLTKNLLTVTYTEAGNTGSHQILDEEQFSYFRSTQAPDGTRKAIYLRVPPAQLSKDEIMAINKDYDQKEGRDNKRAKRDVAKSISEYFNGKSFQVYEYGCGNKPILHSFTETEGLSYIGIEVDDNILEELHTMDIPAASWESIMSVGRRTDMPSISVSIYAMHFMIDDQFADRIKHTISDDGFFVGNFYHTSQEQETGRQHERLKTILDGAGLTYRVLKQPNNGANEYWVIGNKSSEDTLNEYARQLKSTLSENKKHPFEFEI